MHGIEVRNDDLLIGTHGRSFYSMDNIGVLRQISRETTNEPVVLFHPSDATRSISRGAAIDYYLKQAADKVVEILAGRVTITTFTGTPESAEGVAAGAVGRRRNRRGRRRRPAAPPARVAAKQGMNRFTWDAVSGARDFWPDHVGRQHAAEAPPGKHKVT